MYPIWLLTQSEETERNGVPPLPIDIKPLDFVGVFDSVEQVNNPMTEVNGLQEPMM